jgi:hypothetical protein
MSKNVTKTGMQNALSELRYYDFYSNSVISAFLDSHLKGFSLFLPGHISAPALQPILLLSQ